MAALAPPAGPAGTRPWTRGQILTELDQQLAVAAALVGRQGQDAGHVVVFCRFLLLENGGG